MCIRDSSMDHLLGLTQEQRLEDYDYLVQTLGDSYLSMGVRDRDNPEDPSAAIFQAYREMIQESDSDEVFYSAVYSTLFRLGTYGHLGIVEPDVYRAYCEAYAVSYTHLGYEIFQLWSNMWSWPFFDQRLCGNGSRFW